MNKYARAFPNYRVKNDFPKNNQISYQINNIKLVKSFFHELKSKVKILSHPTVNITLQYQIILKRGDLNN